MKKITGFVVITLIVCSCSKNEVRYVEKLITRGQIEKVEKLIEENKIEDVKKVKEMLFNKTLSDIILHAKKSEFDEIRTILNEKEFMQDQYNLICEKIYNVFNSYNGVLELIDSKLPPDSYCFDDTLLMCAVKAQDVESVKKLLEKGADTSLRQKNNGSNALFLSAVYDTKNSVEIFSLLLDKTEIKDGELFRLRKEKVDLSWYFEQLVRFKQKEMMNLFLKKDGVKEIVLKREDTLKTIVSYPYYNDMVPSEIVNYDLAADMEYDYFFKAITSYNYEIVPVLIKKKIHLWCKGEDEFIKDFISNPRTRKLAGLFELDNGSEEYNKIIALSPVIKKYYDDNPIFNLLSSNLYVYELASPYAIITNDDLDNPVKLDKEYVISGYKLEPDKRWYLLVDIKAKQLVRYIDHMSMIGGFYIDGDYFIYDGGTSETRSIYIYGIKDKSYYSTVADSFGKNYIIVNSKLKKVAVQFYSNKSFFPGVDNPDTARVGIRVIDMVTNEVNELIPDKDVNYLLYSFDDELRYKVNDEIKIFSLK